MLRKLLLLPLLALALPFSPAQAGLYSDELAKCLVAATKPADQIVLIQWMFSALALHPEVQPYSSIPPEQREQFNRKAAELFVRLISTDCRDRTIEAVKYEGSPALGPAFNVLGQTAMRGLMTEGHVAEGLQALGSYVETNPQLKGMMQGLGLDK